MISNKAIYVYTQLLSGEAKTIAYLEDEHELVSLCLMLSGLNLSCFD